jgi:nicotinamidase-related amidase
MNFPAFYDPHKVGQSFTPNTPAAVEAGRSGELSPAAKDDFRVVLVLVDMQVDFIHADGALCVPGAIEDTRRTIEWIFRNVGSLTTIAASLDSHLPIQIFSPTWWVNKEGRHPEPFTPIHAVDVHAGMWSPVYEPEWSVEYVEKLETHHKKELMIWPYHTLIGTPGHNLTPALYEAIAYHSAARQAQPTFISKGSIPKTEHYSMIEPEVKVPEQPMGELNTPFLHMLATHDLIYIAGQAKSHCVLETVNSMMRYFANQREIIDRLRVLIDCTSSVAHPEIDFDAIANEALARHELHGLTLVRSDDPIG